MLAHGDERRRAGVSMRNISAYVLTLRVVVGNLTQWRDTCRHGRDFSFQLVVVVVEILVILSF